MSRFGDTYTNVVTREHAVILRGSEDRGEGPFIVHLKAGPGAAVIGEHIHPYVQERFTIVRGCLEARIGGKRLSLRPGEATVVDAGVPHDWWNASATEDAHVLIELHNAPGNKDFKLDRFELMIGTLFGLANDGRVDRKGRPSLLQAALIAREFADVIVFTRPQRTLQLAAIGILAPIGRLLGYQPTYDRYISPQGTTTPDASIVRAAGLNLRSV
jgi:quercetin dioxygenase-like cupin family protein